jgi:DNA mismatch repair ATPase MutS
VSDILEQKGQSFTPVSFRLNQGISLLTGPNMGGKTVALSTAGLLQSLAQYSMPVPAQTFRFRPVERIRFVGGDLQSVEDGLSTFGGEVVRLAEVLKEMQDSGTTLLLLDEVGRATNPMEGEALAVGLARYLHETNAMVLFATHYAGVAETAKEEGWMRWKVAGLGDRRIVPADSVQSELESLQIAERLGLPREVLSLARHWLHSAECKALREGSSDGQIKS